MSAAAASSASSGTSIYEQNNSYLQQQQQQQQVSSSSFGNLPDTIGEFGTLCNSINNPAALLSTAGNGPTQGFVSTTTLESQGSFQPVTCGMLAMGTPSSGNYMFSPMPNGNTLCSGGIGGGESSDHSSTSSSRTRLVGGSGGGGGSINDSGLSTLSSNNGCGNSILMPSNLLSSTPVQYQLQQQPVNMCYGSPDSELKSGLAGAMGLGGVDEVDDFEAVPRDRCNTWPLRRPTLDINAQTSPLIHDRIPEEDNAYDESSDTIDEADAAMMGGDGSEEMGMIGSPSGFSNEMSPMRSDSAMGDESRTDSPPSNKKSTTRRNAWGNMSYADLITQAILNSPDKRLTLSQVYEWMVQNVPYFRDKGDSNSSAGWKNSIRHNLSLHSRFMRIQNEGAGKSSWWVINPDAKPGRNPRRRAATMETATKGIIDKKRRGARKRVEMALGRGGAPLHSAGTSIMSSQASILSQDYEGDDVLGAGSNFDTFRPRTQSTLSIPERHFEGTSSRVSPTLEPPGFEDFDFPPWMDAVSGVGNPEHVTEILDRTDQMRLDNVGGIVGPTDPFVPIGARPLLNGIKLEPQVPLQQQPGVAMDTTIIKQEPMGNVQPPPSYQELNAVRGSPSQLQNSLLRGVGQVTMTQAQKLPAGMPTYYNRNGSVFTQPSTMGQQTTSPPTQGFISMGQPQWAPSSSMGPPPPQQTYMNNTSNNAGGLPQDLENLAMPADQSIMLDLDMEAVLRHELNQSRDHQLHFDMP